MKIDSHQHFWNYNQTEYGWIGENMDILKRDFLPTHLQDELKTVGFDGSVAVQARQNLNETEWLLKLSKQYQFIKGVVGWVNLSSTDIEMQLKRYGQNPKFVGVRHVIHDEPDIDFMLGTAFLGGLKMLHPYNLTYDLLIFPEHLPNTLKLVQAFPDQIFILDHIAKPFIKKKILSPWKEGIESLANFSNVFCKVSGMVTETDWKTWKKEDFWPYLDCIFKAFGPDRIMIGSDWPVCKLAGQYQQVMGIVEDYIQSFTEGEKNKILGENAIKAYSLKM